MKRGFPGTEAGASLIADLLISYLSHQDSNILCRLG